MLYHAEPSTRGIIRSSTTASNVPAFQPLDRMLTLGCFDRIETRASEHAADECADRVFIVRDQHAGALSCSSLLRLFCVERQRLAAGVDMARPSLYRALIVEDDSGILKLVKFVLEQENLVVEEVRNAAAAINLLGPERTTCSSST
jgi:hypothetical protein